MEHIEVILKTADILLNNNIETAKGLIESEYKHHFIKYESRSMSTYEKLCVYYRDGFIDRYSGKKLLFPCVLRIFTNKLGNVFPFHTNWKMSDCHIAYWEMMPTYDHIIPIARGGKDEFSNVVTTSQIFNSKKSNFLLGELEIELFPCGKINEWDGMIKWYKEIIKNDPNILNDKYIYDWNRALIRIEEENKSRTIASTG